MTDKVNLCKVYKISENMVVRKIQGEIIMIPVTSGLADFEGNIFSLNKTGQAICAKMNGKKTLKEISEELALEFTGSAEDIKYDVLGLVKEFLKREMVIEVK